MSYNKDNPNKEEKMQTKKYHVYKVSEGGLGQHTAKDIAVRSGAKKVQCCTSHYIGQTAIVVTATKKVHDKIFDRLY